MIFSITSSMLHHSETPQQLSMRENEVLKLITEGYSNVEIAQMLHISPHTVKTHIRSIFNKLGVDHRVQAVVIAIRTGLV